MTKTSRVSDSKKALLRAPNTKSWGLTKTSIIGYWCRLVTSHNENKLTSLFHKRLYQLYIANIFRSKWLESVETILNSVE